MQQSSGTNMFHIGQLRMFDPSFGSIFCFSNACFPNFFVDNVNSPGSWKVVLRQELRGRKSKFTRDVNLELTMFEVGNNANHVNLRVSVENAVAPLVTWHLWMVN
jgi:hypothetical protein